MRNPGVAHIEEAAMTGISDTIERSVTIGAPIERVWALVSQPGWWINDGSALRLDLIEPQEEDRALVHHPEHGDFLIERVAVDPPRSIAFRWVVSGAADRVLADGTPTLRTTVTFTLAESEEGTRLTVVERGFAQPDVDETARRTAYEGNTEGWTIELALAAAHLS
jgi:uncharacterized protein YndB with AHSA1/START domain